MRIKALIVLTALAATAMPAFAQGYGRSCQEVRKDNQVGGAILGGILGGVLGSNVAAGGHRHDGTAVGAVLGGIVGSGVGGSVKCAPSRSGYGNGYGPGSDYDRNPNYGGSRYYGNGSYGEPGYGYSAGPGDSSYRYGNDPYDDGYRGDVSSHARYPDDLYPTDRGAYNPNHDVTGLDCSDATQVTRMPDGSEIHRPIHVCRDAYDGEWRVKD